MLVANNVDTTVFCALQCITQPECQAIEICPQKDHTLCRLCNFTDPTFIANETGSCRHLQLDNDLGDEKKSDSKGSVFHTCKDVLSNSNFRTAASGLYSIVIDNKPTDVWCDMETDGGGWTRRQSGDIDFYRSWNEYKAGFGNVSGEYWIGNDVLHVLTTRRNVSLRVELEQFKGTKGHGTYSDFMVANETMNYKLSLSGYNGNIKNCLGHNNGKNFTTKDRDNDISQKNCAITRQSGWWHGICTRANLNGHYFTFEKRSSVSVYCSLWTNETRIALKKTKMMIR